MTLTTRPKPTCPYDLLEAYWRTALVGALHDAGVPGDALNAAQLGEITNTLIMAREQEPSADTFIARAALVTMSPPSS